jgi:hypothetical protein
MKSRIFALLAVALILVTSLSVVGCGGGGGANFKVSPTVTFSANPVEVNTAVTISATITNDGGDSGTSNATLTVGGASVETKSVVVAAKGTQAVTFSYTPKTEGTFDVSIGLDKGKPATGTLGVTQALAGYWDIKYTVATGSRITLNYSLGGIGGKTKITNLSDGDGAVTIRVNKTVVNGAREIILLSSGWQLKSLTVTDISPGVNMDLIVSLNKDAKGVLYVQDGVGDVDMSSSSARTTKPKQTDKFGDGKNDPAGSMLVSTLLDGLAHVSVGKDVPLPFGFVFTTGSSKNVVSIPSTKFNGATMVSQGVAFAKDGGVAPYVGTVGTITTTGTGDCLGLTLLGFPIDFQAEIKLVLKPVN